MTTRESELRQSTVQLPDGRPRLAVRSGAGAGRPFVLVHGLASNARLWDGVAHHLLQAGHAVLAVDQRGHGLSEAPASGYDTDTCADDLAALIATVGLDGEQTPIVVGQSWGGNVVLSLAARHPGTVVAACCVDGGWIRLRDRFASFDDCWAALEPPRFDGLTFADLAARIRQGHPDWPAEGIEGTLANLVELPGGGVQARLARAHHACIVRSLFDGDPYAWYPLIDVPVLLCPAGSPPSTGGRTTTGDERSEATRSAVGDAARALPQARVRWYPGADHDLHAQHPGQLAQDLLALAAQVDPAGPGNPSTPDLELLP